MANNFKYTEPATGISMGSFESGGVHFQGIVLTNSSGTALPADTTYGLGVDIKRAVIPTGATSLTKAEGAAFAAGDAGVLLVGVNPDTNYAVLKVDDLGNLRVSDNDGAVKAIGDMTEVMIEQMELLELLLS